MSGGTKKETQDIVTNLGNFKIITNLFIHLHIDFEFNVWRFRIVATQSFLFNKLRNTGRGKVGE